MQLPFSRAAAAPAIFAAALTMTALPALADEPAPIATTGDTETFSCDAPDLSHMDRVDIIDTVLPATVSINTTVLSTSADEENPDEAPLPERFPDFHERFGIPDEPEEETPQDDDSPAPGTPEAEPKNEDTPGVIEPELMPRGMGSGFFIDPRGYVLTNQHVIAEADGVTVTLFDPAANHGRGGMGEEKIKAEIIGVDIQHDLAVLKIETDSALTCAAFGDSYTLSYGDEAIAIGNPAGLGGTVTGGMISAFGRALGGSSPEAYLQTDTPINRGNSGGALFNMDGEVIGINTMILSGTGWNAGIGFALESNAAVPIIAEIIATNNDIQHGWLGVSIADIDETTAAELGAEAGQGVLIREVVPGGPAEAAGLQENDILLNIKGITLEHPGILVRNVMGARAGETVTFDVQRDGALIEMPVTLGNYWTDRPEPAEAAENDATEDAPEAAPDTAPEAAPPADGGEPTPTPAPAPTPPGAG